MKYLILILSILTTTSLLAQQCDGEECLEKTNKLLNGSASRSILERTEGCTIVEEESDGDYYIYDLGRVEFTLCGESEWGFLICVRCCRGSGSCINYKGETNSTSKTIEVSSKETAVKVITLMKMYKNDIKCFNYDNEVHCKE